MEYGYLLYPLVKGNKLSEMKFLEILEFMEFLIPTF